MLRTNIIYLFSVVTICCSYNFVSAQPPDDQIVISPQIHPDKTVTFRYMAPSARNVMLSGQFEKQASAMKKDSSGTWSVTIGPVKPDIYPYYFIADGIQVMDPANVDYFPNERFKASLVDIPGDSALIHSKKNVPHGTVTYEYYPSFGFITGSLVVYTPPDYEKNTTALYPVLYLLPGTSDTEETWFKVGKVNLILDNLIAENKARSMIIVMPNGNVEATIAEQTGRPKPADPADRGSTEAIQRSISFQNDLINNIIPYIEKNYRVVSNRYGRAIGGFSRGGGQALRTGFGNMDMFSWICCFSAYLTDKEMESTYSNLWEDSGRTNELLNLLWVSVGNQDSLYSQTREFMDFLTEKNINYKSLITPGSHTWMNSRTFLAETAQVLFQ